MRTVDLVHGPEHEAAVDMDGAVAIGGIGPVRNHAIKRAVEGKAHELAPGVQGRGAAVAVRDVDGGHEVDRQGPQFRRGVRSVLLGADGGHRGVGRVELALAGVLGEKPLGGRERRPDLPVPLAPGDLAPGEAQGAVSVGIERLRDAVVDSYSFINDRRSRTYQFAGGGAWTPGAFSPAADVSYTQSNSNTDFASLAFGATAPILRQDLSGKFQSLAVEGIDLTNPGSYVFDRTSEYYARNTGSELAGRLDAAWKSDGGFIRQLKTGFRYTETKATNTAISFADRGIAGTPVSAFPGAGVVQNTNLFYRITDNPGLPTQFLAPPIDIIRNFGQVRSVFGQAIEGPQADPLSSYDLTEKTYAGYVMADLALTLAGVEITGNVGVRAVRTETGVKGFQALPGGAIGPLQEQSSYTNWLPNLNLKAQLTDGLIVRFAANKGVARPSFSLLSPSLFLDYQFRTGYAGNPALAPFKSDNYDISAEYYFSRTGYVYAAGFYKRVEGFVQTITNPETYGGQVFQVQRPSNGSNGKIKGAEIGIQTFFDFLPAPFDGFGAQANFTYVDSEAPGPIAGQAVPLEGLSRESYNLIGLYEKGPLSARVAYNWRSSFVQTTAGPGTGSNPLFNRGGGILDASISYDLSEDVTFTVDAVNLTRTRNLLYYGQENRPNEFSITDRRFGARVQFRF